MVLLMVRVRVFGYRDLHGEEHRLVVTLGLHGLVGVVRGLLVLELRVRVWRQRRHNNRYLLIDLCDQKVKKNKR